MPCARTKFGPSINILNPKPLTLNHTLLYKYMTMISFINDMDTRTKTKDEFKSLVTTVKPKPYEGEKVYKGDIMTVADLAAGMTDIVAIQAIKPDTEPYPGYNNFCPIPPMCVVTKLVPNTRGTVSMHYYAPQTGVRSYRDVAKTFKLNVLKGTKGEELLKEWNTARIEKLGTIGRRLTCTVGTDPEIFAVDPQGEVVPAWMYLPDKAKPKHFKSANHKTGTLYWDGFQAEFTTQGTDTCLLWMSDNVQAGIQAVYDAAKAVGAKLTIQNVLPVNPDYLQTESLEHVQFGCAPSYNVYGLQGNIQDGRDVPFRFAGGHLHFGVSHLPTNPEARQQVIEKYVRALDMILGVASVSLLGELDNPIRRQFYGLPGEYRMPKHGFEYRVLSNAWLCHPLAMNMVYDLARAVCGLAEEGLLEGWQGDEDEMKAILMQNDIAGARAVLDRNKVMFKQICKVITGTFYTLDEHLEKAFDVWRNGLSTVVKDMTDLVSNWNLEPDTQGMVQPGRWVLHGDGKGKNWHKAYAWFATEKV